MERTLRGRPRLSLTLIQIVEAVRRRGQITAAARELNCSDGYVHSRFRAAGLTLRDVLEAPELEALLHGRE